MKRLLLLSTLIFLFISSQGQLQIRLGTLKTDSKNTAISIGLSYIRSLDSIWNSKELYVAGKRSIFTLNPQIKIETGTQDAFSTVEGKLTGLFMSFKTKKLDSLSSIIIPDVSKAIMTFPVSLGFESNNTFSTINAIAEVGWVPWYQSETSNAPGILRYSKIGLFLQGGYKFKGDSTANKAFGGAIDESAEKVNNTLLRTKGSFSIDTKRIINISGLQVGVVGNADFWYDFVNGKLYSKVEGIGRFYLADGKYFDVVYAKGSGAPNFNTGEQFGIGLTIKF